MKPITREEKLLDGQVLEPITRKEAFIRRIYDKTQPVPEPITREEWFLNKAAEGSGGDVTIEQLNVSQNGTYSEQGKAYSPVIVEVPEPVLTTKNITANGTYLASEDNADGYNSVEVSVAPPENSFILNTKKDDVVDISDAADFDIAGLKVDVTSSDEVLVGVGNGTEFVGNNMPYLFRETPHNVGDRVYEDAIVGGSVAWNQLMRVTTTGNFGAENCTIATGSTNSIIATYSGSGSQVVYQTALANAFTIEIGHKVLALATIKPNADVSQFYFRFEDYDSVGTAFSSPYLSASANVTKQIGTIVNFTTRFTRLRNKLYLSQATTTTEIGDVMLIDLTRMFGSTIADYAYTLETSEAGSGIAWLKSQGFFTKDYYAYNAGGIESVKTSAKKVTGFNQWDEVWEVGNISTETGQNTSYSGTMRSKNYIRVLPNTTYYFECSVTATGSFPFFAYDSEKNYLGNFDVLAKHTFTTPSNCAFIRFRTTSGYGATYNHDICINFHWDGERDGEYEPYVEHTYPLDSDLELRGIPKLDTNNKLYYDGDIYASDGTVTRKYGIVDLGSLTWQANTTGTADKYRMKASISGLKMASSASVKANLVCSKYLNVSGTDTYSLVVGICASHTESAIFVYDSNYDTITSASAFKTAMDGVYLVYEKTTPTTESADPYTNPQIVDNWGTEEYIDTRDVPIPVGHETKYFDGEIFFSYIYDGSGNKTTATGTADLITGEVTGGNHCDTFVIKPTGDNVVVETGEVEVKYLVPLEAI